MMTPLFGLLLALQTPAQLPVPIPPDAYADSATATLIRRARSAQNRNGDLVTSYHVKASQRFGIGMKALSRDRMIYHNESVVQIDWQRDSQSTVTILGSREGVPVAMNGEQVASSMRSNARRLVFDPAAKNLLGDLSDEEDFVRHPLADGAERYYRYAKGDSATIKLPTGTTLHIVGITVTPRTVAYNLMSGTLWFDDASASLVRMVYRPARPFEFARDADVTDRDDVPGWINPKFEVKFVTVDYGFYEGRWWMPRYIAYDGEGSMGNWLGVPFRAETSYEDYEVAGGTPRDSTRTFIPAGRRRPISAADTSKAVADSLRASRDSQRKATRDSISRLPQDSASVARRDSIIRARRDGSDSSLRILVRGDSASLLHAPELGPPILTMGDLITEAELKGVDKALRKLPARPWETHVTLPRSLGAAFRNARYNRVEALSLGYSAQIDFGKLLLAGTARIGAADLEPNGELGLTRPLTNGRFTISGYRRLATANPENKPFGFLNSALALISQRDDGEYYRTLGAEISATNTSSGRWSLRLYHQKETAAVTETHVALPHLFSSAQRFRSNIVADEAIQTGGALTLRSSHVYSHTFSTSGEFTVDGALGDYEFGRLSSTLRLFITPPGKLAGGLTYSYGQSTGEIPIQSLFYLGGAGSVRGYPGGSIRGDEYHLWRAEVGTSFPGARLALFTDYGHTNRASDPGSPVFGAESTIHSIGIGASFLDGLLRFDLASPLKGRGGLRLEMYLDGVM